MLIAAICDEHPDDMSSLIGGEYFGALFRTLSREINRIRRGASFSAASIASTVPRSAAD